jgi:hypothetical protein
VHWRIGVEAERPTNGRCDSYHAQVLEKLERSKACLSGTRNAAYNLDLSYKAAHFNQTEQLASSCRNWTASRKVVEQLSASDIHTH